jgi:hypothetical protein
MWQGINAYATEALDSNALTIDLLKEAQNACNGDGQAALAKLFLIDLVGKAHTLDIYIRQFMLAINHSVKNEAERSKE